MCDRHVYLQEEECVRGSVSKIKLYRYRSDARLLGRPTTLVYYTHYTYRYTRDAHCIL